MRERERERERDWSSFTSESQTKRRSGGDKEGRGGGEGGEEWWEGVSVWNQVFRVRGVRRRKEAERTGGSSTGTARAAEQQQACNCYYSNTGIQQEWSRNVLLTSFVTIADHLL